MQSRLTQASNRIVSLLGSLLSLILCLGLFGYIGFMLIRGQHESKALEGRTIRTKAMIIDKRNYLGNSPVSYQLAYSYSFYVKGKEYVNNSRDHTLKIGDSLTIEYVPDDPSINQPIH